MHESELQILADDADYAASQQRGTESMTRSDSVKHSSSSEHDDAEVVYVKDIVVYARVGEDYWMIDAN